MIDPRRLTGYGRTEAELEEVILFGILAAGKTGMVAARSLGVLLRRLEEASGEPGGPLALLRRFRLAPLRRHMAASGIGCRKVKGRGLYELARAGLDLRSCTTAELEKVHSIGPKTSRLFTLHTREGCRDIPLDTHNLAELAALGHKDVPRSTPPAGRRYARLEALCLAEADRAGLTPAAWDLGVWLRRSGNASPSGDETSPLAGVAPAPKRAGFAGSTPKNRPARPRRTRAAAV